VCYLYVVIFSELAQQRLPPHGYPLEHPFNKVRLGIHSFGLSISLAQPTPNYVHLYVL
jgi:hypothetical protein